jgi:hypothetical protein
VPATQQTTVLSHAKKMLIGMLAVCQVLVPAYVGTTKGRSTYVIRYQPLIVSFVCTEKQLPPHSNTTILAGRCWKSQG